MSLLSAQGICKSFPGIQALNDVSFYLEPGTVHALMGENGAGKSTLVKCFMGVSPFDSGEMTIKGRNVQFSHPRQAIASGLSMIEQELTPVEELTAAENIFLGRESVKRGLILDYSMINRKASAMMASLDLEIDVTQKMRSLSLAEIQLVEIAKALSYESEIIIMDEPTSAIGEKEVDTLFGLIRKLKDQGKGIIYVSHRMDEIFKITDEITILRDGEYIDTVRTSEVSREEVVEKMVGRKVGEEYIKENSPSDSVVLSVRNMTQSDVINGISLDLNKGEILGIFGLMGSGRSEFCDLLFGVSKKDAGEVLLNGKQVHLGTPKKAIRKGLAYVTEDRKNSGLYLKGSVNHNISLSILKSLSRFGILKLKDERSKTQRMVDRFRIKTTGLEQIVLNLSGGNQQKVVLGKWLIQNPTILILDEPTRGIDVGAKREIYQFMSEYASQGNSIILISSELTEVLNMSDRIIVFKDGRTVAELSREQANQNNVMHFASANEVNEVWHRENQNGE